MNKALVTVLIITYNHIKTFEQAINSVLAQKTNFDIQIIVLDDASTDGTTELVRKYQEYDNVKCVSREENIGGAQNVYEGLKLIDTKYYAILESDDYWCDENKLQMQIDILESNPDCSFCAHNTLVKYLETGESKPYKKSKTRKFTFPAKKICTDSYIEPHTSSRLYRTSCLDLTEIDNPIVYTYDIATNFYFLTKGNLYYIDKIMSVYNYTNTGVYSGASAYKQRYKSAFVISSLNTAFGYKYNYLLARFFATRINLNFIKYLQLKYTKHPQTLQRLYQHALDKYSKVYLTNYDIKPIFRLALPCSQKKRLVFELKREKDRV